MDVPEISKLQVQDDGQNGPNTTTDPSIEKIQQLLKAKDGTSRFVGLALLKSVLDNSPELQRDERTITMLWSSVSPKFLDRLLRTGSQAGRGQKNSKDMLDMAVAVIHTFTVLLPQESINHPSLLNRIPGLVKGVLHSSKETTEVIIKTLLTLVAVPEGAKCFANLDVDDWTPLVEIAPEHAHVLTIFIWAWEKGTAELGDEQSKNGMRSKIDKGIQALVSSFIGTDATNLLEFISHLLRTLDEHLIPQNPTWLGSVTKLIHNLSTNKPTAASRSAYINCTGVLLLVYPDPAFELLFGSEQYSSNPPAYLFITLVLVDLRATLPSLLEKLNDPDYPQISQRLTSALDILTVFISRLIALDGLEDDSTESNPENNWLKWPPELIIKLSKSIHETIAIIIEHLRDRWDASTAGAHGLHPEARAGSAHTNAGSHKTLAWDSKDSAATTDAFIQSAIRAIGLWIRDDDNDTRRKEAAGLMDMFMELYQTNHGVSFQTNRVEYRLPILAALEGILRTKRGVEAFTTYEGWKILSQDLRMVLQESSASYPPPEVDLIGGTRIAVVLQILADEVSSTPEEWMGLVTAVAAYDVPAAPKGAAREALLDFQTDVLNLAVTLLMKASPGLRKRYVHSASAIRGIVKQVRGTTDEGSDAAKGLEDMLLDLDTLVD